jgi:hypothetical protein
MIANLRISFAVVRIAQSSAQYLIRMQGRMHGPHCVQKRYFARRNDKSRGTNPPSNSYKTIMNNLTKASLFLVLALSTALLSAQAKPNFTGVWVLNLAKSDLGGAPITKISVEIDHNDPILKYTAKGTAGGQDFVETEILTTDGKPGHDSRGAVIATHWEDNMLVSVATTEDGHPFYEMRMTLAADGKSCIRDFLRTSPDDPQKRHEIYDKQ